MNSIEKDFRSEMDQIETERLDSELPVILAGKVERLLEWIRSSDVLNDELAKWIYKDIDNPDLYNYFINNVDNK